MSAPPPRVWFLVLDSATGEPYKGTNADKVYVASPADVADFRDAVRAKHSNKLSGFASSQLLVYQNKAAFDKRNAAVDEGKEEPLEDDSLVDGLGTMKKEALVVAVPSFPLCQVPFFNNICDVTESDGWISFGQNIPSTSLNNLYIRESYRTIASSVNPGINKALVTGTTGIGKSLFLIYLLWKLVKEEKRVLVIYRPFKIYYDGKGSVFMLGKVPSTIDFSFWNDTLWCLFDDRGHNDLNEFPYELCTFVVSTSPRRAMLKAFKRHPVPQVFYVPTWTEAELKAIAPLFPNANEWRGRFEILGGIPRHVLEVTTQTPTAMLEGACRQCSLDDCIKEIDMYSTSSESEDIYYLVHITSAPPFTNSSVCYASPTALNIIVRCKGIEAKRRMSELFSYYQGNPLFAALCGFIVEPYAIELLEKGGTFTCRPLVHGNKRIKPNGTKLEIPSSIERDADKVVPNQNPQCAENDEL